eukprot:1148080-Pelagomonas_calceolata.AAC.1
MLTHGHSGDARAEKVLQLLPILLMEGLLRECPLHCKRLAASIAHAVCVCSVCTATFVPVKPKPCRVANGYPGSQLHFSDVGFAEGTDPLRELYGSSL